MIKGPYTLEIDFTFLPMAEIATGIPGVLRSGRCIRMEFTDYKKLYDAVGLLCTISTNVYPFDR